MRDFLHDRRHPVPAMFEQATGWSWPEFLRSWAGELERLRAQPAAVAALAQLLPGNVELRAGVVPEGVRITLRDSGPGISAEHLARVFDRFYKADPSRTVNTTSGSGLGLSIVQAIVERHNGRISATNAPEGGALFEIVLPAHADTQAA